MINVLFLTKFNQQEIKEMPAVPRIGDRVDLFSRPAPKVVGVLWFPNVEGVDVIVTLD